MRYVTIRYCGQSQIGLRGKPVTNEQDNRHLTKLSRMMDTFSAATGDHASVKVVESFCLAATHEGMSVVDLAKLAGSTRTTMSRHLMDLSEILRNGKDGYKLLQRNQDPRNMRTVFYTLTPKGHKLSRKLKELMEE